MDISVAKLCQGLLDYSLILSEMQRIALSHNAFVGVYVRMCSCVCICVFVSLNVS